MKTLIKTTAFLIGLSPLALAAQDWTPTDEDLDVFRDAVFNAGCIVTDEATAVSIEAATGFTEDELDAIVQQLRIYQEVIDASEEGGFQLVSGACAA